MARPQPFSSVYAPTVGLWLTLLLGVPACGPGAGSGRECNVNEECEARHVCVDYVCSELPPERDGSTPDAFADTTDGGSRDVPAADGGSVDSALDAENAGDGGLGPDVPIMDVGMDVPPPEPTDRVVFVSSEHTDGMIGGLAGADALCQRAASAAGLAGVFVALMSSNAESAATRVSTLGEVRDTAGELIAADGEEFFGGSIRTPIALDEFGDVSSSVLVWTGTDPDGAADRHGHLCNDWTTIEGTGEIGRTDRSDTGWLSVYEPSSSSNPCSVSARVYCINLPVP